MTFGQSGIDLRLAWNFQNGVIPVVVEAPGAVGELQISAGYFNPGILLHSLIQDIIGKCGQHSQFFCAETQVSQAFGSQSNHRGGI